MPIRFRCTHCEGLMAISSRQAGAIVECPTCGQQTQVPLHDIFDQEASKPIPPPEVAGDLEQTAEAHPDVSRGSDEAQFNSPPLAEKMTSEADPAVGTGHAEEFDVPEFADSSPHDVGVSEADEEDGDENRFVIRRRRLSEDEMDLTPMVDVTFQLLIFFMVSASFSLQKSIEVPLPDPDQQGASQQVQMLDDLLGTSIILKIDSSNTILIDDEPLVDPSRLVDALQDKMRREQKTELLVTADSQSHHRTVIAVIDAANEAGMQKIRMTTRKKTE